MNTGERLWWIPVGEVDDAIRNHAATQGVDLSRAGGGGLSIQMVAGICCIRPKARTVRRC